MKLIISIFTSYKNNSSNETVKKNVEFLDKKQAYDKCGTNHTQHFTIYSFHFTFRLRVAMCVAVDGEDKTK